MSGSGPILITGAAGFIGSNLTDRLVANGQEVVAVDSFDDYYDAAIKHANLTRALSSGGVRLLVMDASEPTSFTDVLRRVEPAAVVHLAARPGVRASFEQPELYVRSNVLGTLRVLQGCRDAGVQELIVASSSSVYGDAYGIAGEERTPLRPLSPYGATKVAAEALCSSFALTYGISVTALRLFTVYGPRQRPDMAIHKFTAAIEAGREITLFGDGTTERDYTNVQDIVDGMIAALRADTQGFHAYNLGGGQPVALSNLVSLIEQGLGREARIRFLPRQEGDPDRTAADISLARDKLGYSPRVGIEEGVGEFVAWYRMQQGRQTKTEVAA